MISNRTVISLLLAVFPTFWIVPIYAEIPFEKYETVKKTEAFKVYLKGVRSGYVGANAYLASMRHLPPLYCQPNKMGLNAENYLRILDEYLSKPEVKNEMPPDTFVELLLLFALQEVFPCK